MTTNLFGDVDTRGFVLHQPYASLVAAGLKTIETRAYSTTWRGRLLICAGQTIDGDGLRYARSLLRCHERAMSDEKRDHRHSCAWWIEGPCDCSECVGDFELTAPLGSVLCAVDLLNVRPLVPEDEPRSWFYEPGRFAWELGPVTLLPRMATKDLTWQGKPVKCFQGRFRVDAKWGRATEERGAA